MSFRSIVPQINENLRRMKASCLCLSSVFFCLRCRSFISAAVRFSSRIIVVVLVGFGSAFHYFPFHQVVSLRTSHTLQLTHTHAHATRAKPLRFDLNPEHKQFVMRWAIISVHVISYTCSTYQNHDAFVPNNVCRLVHEHYTDMFIRNLFYFSAHCVRFRSLRSCQFRCVVHFPNARVNTCLLVWNNKHGYSNIVMTTWRLKYRIIETTSIFVLHSRTQWTQWHTHARATM